jgi:type I restriction enzyme M protein
MISNPPFGVNWSEYKDDALRLVTSRYKWGTPDVGDGALLFLLTMIEKMKPAKEGGSKIAVLFNGSPLSNGDALQGESEIRRHILQNDLLDTIVMMPDQMFYNTGIYTYIWLLNNNKSAHKRGKVLILNARDQFEKEPKSFGNKRNRIAQPHREWIDAQFAAWQANAACKVFKTSEFAFHKVKVVFWQTDEHAEPMWITEAFDVQLNNGNVQKRFELYGDMTIYLTVDIRRVGGAERDTHHSGDVDAASGGTVGIATLHPPYESTVMELHYDGGKAFDTLVAEDIKQTVAGYGDQPLKDIKKALKDWKMTATYRHRHYIVDNEYIPFDDAADDKAAYINAFLAREIEHPIISWEEYAQLGYEILPNKYFYQYQEPTPSDQLIEQFWALEKQAEQLLQDIKEL